MAVVVSGFELGGEGAAGQQHEEQEPAVRRCERCGADVSLTEGPLSWQVRGHPMLCGGWGWTP